VTRFTRSGAARGYLPTRRSFVTKQPSELKMFTTPGSRVLYYRLETGAHLILIGLLSLGLWAAVWAVLTSLI
jgi:urea transporter